jgi:hypothetical protein
MEISFCAVPAAYFPCHAVPMIMQDTSLTGVAAVVQLTLGFLVYRKVIKSDLKLFMREKHLGISQPVRAQVGSLRTSAIISVYPS